eukprot:CAMPEP_0170743570 /NCGR_PEP_ID=MMETSP0437-20130122/7336_1 /TAXON_ID=0 /ORGANISM="Sexangularia sp." /LENGTH=469 /DNA_ID=CAMNT_0011082243 /DNA_START=1 /DNA_END=1407 /DNA_ORIENTATION=+
MPSCERCKADPAVAKVRLPKYPDDIQLCRKCAVQLESTPPKYATVRHFMPEGWGEGTEDVDGTPIVFLLALFDFTADPSKNQLSFRQGDLIKPLTMSGNWWFGVHKTTGAKGLFPRTFVAVRQADRNVAAAPKSAPAPGGVDREGLPEAIALFAYTAKKDSEISFAPGDRIVQVRKMQGDWWRGAVASTGRRGYFPASYVKVEEQTASADLADQVFTTEKPPHARALFAFTANGEAELSFRADDVLGEVVINPAADWWQGTLRGKRGYFPADYVTLLDKALAATVIPAAPFTGRARFAFNGADSNQLTFIAGELVVVLATTGTNGWWAGKARGKVGFFPANAVRQLAPGDDGAAATAVVASGGSAVKPTAPPPLPPMDDAASPSGGEGDESSDESSDDDGPISYQRMVRNMYKKEMAALASMSAPTMQPVRPSGPAPIHARPPPPPSGKCHHCGMINGPSDTQCRQCGG